MFNLKQTWVKHTHCTSTHYTSNLCSIICISHQGVKRYRAYKTVSLTLKCQLNLDVTLEKNALSTLSHGTLHLCQVIPKCHQPSKAIEQTRNTVIQCLTLTMTLTLNQPWSNIHTAHQFIILDIFAGLFVNPTRGSNDIQCPPKVWRQPVIFLLPSITTRCPIKFNNSYAFSNTLI